MNEKACSSSLDLTAAFFFFRCNGIFPRLAPPSVRVKLHFHLRCVTNLGMTRVATRDRGNVIILRLGLQVRAYLKQVCSSP